MSEDKENQLIREVIELCAKRCDSSVAGLTFGLQGREADQYTLGRIHEARALAASLRRTAVGSESC